MGSDKPVLVRSEMRAPLDFGEEFKQGDHRLGLIVPFTLEAEAFPVSAHLPPSACRVVSPFSHCSQDKTTEKELAAGPKVSFRPALPFPRLLLLFPDRVQTPPNTSAISL